MGPAVASARTGSLPWLVVPAALVTAYVLVMPWPLVQAVVYVAVAAAAIGLVAFGGLRRWPGPAWPWLLVAAGMATWLVGYAWLLLVREVTGALPASPSVSDLFHLAGYPPVVAGALALATYRQRRTDRAAWLDTAIVGTAVATAAWLLIVSNLDPEAGLVAEGLAVAYGLADVAVACLVVRWLLQPGPRPFAFCAFSTALGLLLLGEVLYLLAGSTGADLGVPASAAHLAGYTAVATGATHPSVRRLALPVGVGTRLSLARLLLLVTAGLLAPVGGALQAVAGVPVDLGALAVAWVVLTALAAARVVQLQTRVQVERARRAADARFRAAFDATATGMALVALDGTDRGRLLEANASLAAMTGRSRRDLVGRRADDLLLPVTGLRLLDLLERRPGQARAVLPAERQLATVGGREVWARVGLAEAGATPGGAGHSRYAVLHVEDVTEQRMVTEQLAQRALHDPLTGLPTRAVLIQLVQAALSVTGDRPPVAVLVLGLDRFALVNSALGHEAGDALIGEIARRLRAVVQPGELVARLAGDEFAVLVEDARRADRVAAAVTAAVAEPVRLAAGEARVTASVGVAVAEDGDGVETLLQHAGVAMYHAKAHGRATALHFDDAMRGVDDERMATEIDLREAVAADALHLAYQPILDLRDGEVVGHEALLRWSRQRGEAVVEMLPGAFLDVAEESGLVVEIGGQALAAALRTAHRLAPEGSRHRVCVNVAARQLVQDGYAASVLHELGRQGVDPARLCLEITENTLIERMDRVVPALHELRAEGVMIALDDFGTGFSSLTHLRYFPVDVVKIDRSFVAGITRSGPDERIVAGVVQLAHALGLSTTAEGVETAEQLAAVRELGCDTAQGFFLGRPAALDSVAAAPSRGGAGRRTPSGPLVR